MATFTKLTCDEAASLGAFFGLSVTDVVAVPAGSVNSNYRLDTREQGAVFARIYEEQDRSGAEGEARLLDHLAARGVATPRPIPRTDGAGFTVPLAIGGRPLALFPWREGDMVCQASVTAKIAGEVGRQLALIHRAGADFKEPRPGRFRIEDLHARLLRIASAEVPELAEFVPVLRRALEQAVAERRALPSGIIHGDLFRDNILWMGGGVAALLDFESASDGPWVYDLMVTVLAWCQGSDLDLTLVRALLAGYQEVRPLSEVEILSLATEGKIAALRFTITRITDFTLRASQGGVHVMKDWRRFWARYERLLALGNAGFSQLIEPMSR